jgi:hypothetical protein
VKRAARDAYERDRWNSTWEMLVRCQKLRPAIDLVTQRDPVFQKQLLQLDDHDWMWIKRLSDVLEVFHEPTVELSASSYPTLSKQYPRYRDISRKLAAMKAQYDEHGSEENATMWARPQSTLVGKN